ncbi:serine protease [Parasalinivibrio latis]|uniref:S1 family peptidase n=1 Tax=Parasalinivibrio latis TaxID=2952610 RepID=UPI0030E05E22
MRSTAQLIPAILLLSLSFSSTAEMNSRIINGNDTTFEAVPWQVLVKLEVNSGTYRCGGTAIDKRWVVTAAHCVDLDTVPNDGISAEAFPYQVKVSAGHTRLEDAMAEANEIAVANVYMHPRYSDIGFINDIALIQLGSDLPPEVVYMALAGSATQANLDDTFIQNGNDKLMSVSGWGLIDDNGTAPENLQVADVIGVADSDCSWVNSEDSHYYICAQSAHTGVCSGDSGGPLVWEDPVYQGDPDGGKRLVGVVSFGDGAGCGLGNNQDGYTQVSTYQDWIASTMGDAPLNPGPAPDPTPDPGPNPTPNPDPDANEGSGSLPFGSSSGGGAFSLWWLLAGLVMSGRKIRLRKPRS